MQKFIITNMAFVLIMAAMSCRKPGETPEAYKLATSLIKDTTTIQFLDSTTFYFDTINEGDKVEHIFRLKNTGTKNLVVANAFGSCGCTVPEYPKEPVKPGDEAAIKVTFNSAGKTNEQTKTVTLNCNTASRNEILYLKGFVIPKDKQ